MSAAAAPTELEPVEIDIPVTLRAGVEHNIGGIRVRVLSHVYKQKPRFKIIGPSTERICPGCKGVYASRKAVQSHFARMHRALPWPWPVGWLPPKRKKPGRKKRV
jgi:hypothetical protein